MLSRGIFRYNRLLADAWHIKNQFSSLKFSGVSRTSIRVDLSPYFFVHINVTDACLPPFVIQITVAFLIF